MVRSDIVRSFMQSPFCLQVLMALLSADYCWPLLFFWAQQKYLASEVIQSVFFLDLTFVFCSQGISSFYRSERQIRSDKPLSRALFSLLPSLPLMPARFVLRQKVRVQFLLFIPFPVQLKKLSSCVCADAFLFVPLWELSWFFAGGYCGGRAYCCPPGLGKKRSLDRHLGRSCSAADWLASWVSVRKEKTPECISQLSGMIFNV